jgi:hypothetical protein
MFQKLRTSTFFIAGIIIGLSLAIGHSVYAVKENSQSIPFEEDSLHTSAEDEPGVIFVVFTKSQAISNRALNCRVVMPRCRESPMGL